MFNIGQPNYTKLRSILKERTNPTVLWFGSGLSVAANLPTWSGLKDRIIETFKIKFQGKKQYVENVQEENELRSIEESDDLWVSFERLHRLGKTTYVNSIKDALSRADTCPIPENYLSLLSLRFSGLITTNIDSLAKRAYAEKFRGRELLVDFTPEKCGRMTHLLQSQRPFLLNAHGILDDSKTWVFRKSELNRLFEQEGYTSFIRNILSTRTVVFVGMSADDVPPRYLLWVSSFICGRSKSSFPATRKIMVRSFLNDLNPLALRLAA